MRSASPPRKVTALGKTTQAAEVLGTDFTQADFISLSDTGVAISGGFAQGVFAVMPDKHLYQKLRFSFGIPTVTGAPTDATLRLLVRDAEGNVTVAGTSTLAADGSFPEIEIDNFDARYYLQVTFVGGTTPAVTVDTFLQGVYTPKFIAVN